MVSARISEATSMMITAIAMAPTKSPGGPGNRAMGMKASAVVTVEASSGTASRRIAAETACSRAVPRSSFLRISSDMTIPASTSRPSATIRPVSDIWWTGIPIAWSPASDIRLARGRIEATINAARQPRVTSRTVTTRLAPISMLVTTKARRSAV